MPWPVMADVLSCFVAFGHLVEAGTCVAHAWHMRCMTGAARNDRPTRPAGASRPNQGLHGQGPAFDGVALSLPGTVCRFLGPYGSNIDVDLGSARKQEKHHLQFGVHNRWPRG